MVNDENVTIRRGFQKSWFMRPEELEVTARKRSKIPVVENALKI
jgi:hypothetical protein